MTLEHREILEFPDQSESLVLVAPLVREVLPGHREYRDSLDLLVFLELWA